MKPKNVERDGKEVGRGIKQREELGGNSAEFLLTHDRLQAERKITHCTTIT